MILTLINYFWIIAASFLVGLFISCHLFRDEFSSNSIDLYIVSGLCFTFAYAEWFSLISGVGAIATILLGVICLLIIICERKQMIDILTGVRESIWSLRVSDKIIMLLMILVSLYYCAKQSSALPDWSDTGLYHAQTIRWIEEYGVVKGLGNLHHRFAYNSAFLVGQALYSWKWLVGQSMHGLNGCISFIVLCYSEITLYVAIRGKKIHAMSDVMKGVLIFLALTLPCAAPNTDTPAMLIAVYLFAKWLEPQEEKWSDRVVIVALIALSCITIKLSVLPLFFFFAIVFVLCIRQHDARLTTTLILLAAFIGVPWVIRNVLISGYVLYPFPALDIISADWKMNPYLVTWDAHEIRAIGKWIGDPTLYGTPLTQWFPHWFVESDFSDRIMFVLSVPSYITAVVIAIIKRRKYLDSVLIAFVTYIYWFISAPAMRFGRGLTVLGIGLAIGLILDLFDSQRFVQYLNAGVLICVSIFLILHMRGSVRKFYPNDYRPYELSAVEWSGGVSVYVPEQESEAYYQCFPETPYINILQYIELRGDDLKDGIRFKQEYMDAPITTRGFEYEPEG